MPRRTSMPRIMRRHGNPASMRPGRNAPENPPAPAACVPSRPRFNEAGAKCPGELAGPRRDVAVLFAASMRPGRNAPENAAFRACIPTADRASMRPGRNAPENNAITVMFSPMFMCFNEAGAKCPGERRRVRPAGNPRRQASMRPGRNAPENYAPLPTNTAVHAPLQ